MSAITTDQLVELLSGKYSREELQSFFENSRWRRSGGVRNGEWCNLGVDYSRSLTEMISEGGFVCKDAFSPDNFPDFDARRELVSQKIESFNLRLVHPRRANLEQAVRYLDSLNLLSAMIEQLIAFGEKFPDLQEEFPILALGSCVVEKGFSLVPCLDRNRALGFVRFSWSGPKLFAHDHWRFLATG